MGTTLHTLAPNKGATKTKKRLGRGVGSRTGKTAGKGMKGQKARTGHHGPIVGFEGGQMPMQRRLPKRGFTNMFRTEAYPINLGMLDKLFDAGEIDVAAMKARGVVPKTVEIVKVLGNGEVTKKFVIKAHRFSASALTKLQAKGGSGEVLAGKKSAAPAAK